MMRRAIFPAVRAISQSGRHGMVSGPCHSFCGAMSMMQGRAFHVSVPALGPKDKKKGGKKGKNDDDDDEDDGPAMEIPKAKVFETAMDATVRWFQGEMAKIKVGGATVELFANLQLPGSAKTIGRAGQVVMKTPTKLLVSVFEAADTQLVVEALKNSGFELNPSVEGNSVHAAIPRPSKENRQVMVNMASTVSEKAKLDVRNARKRGADEAKKVKAGVSEDDFRRFNKELDAMTEKKVEAITTAFKAKEKELMAGV